MKAHWLIRTVMLVSLLAMTDVVAAQGTSESSSERPLESVVVTAQKVEEDVKDVPSSVATLGGEKMDVITSGGQDIRLLAARVPSLFVESSFGRTFPRFYIRGLGNTDFDLNASQPVSLVYDEVVLENPILKGFPIFDLDRVEVLRGPQGTLFGRNTPAGIVKFESRKPSHTTDGFGRFSYGRYNTMQFEGAVGGSLVERVLAGRVSFLYQGRSDWVDNTFTNEENALGSYTEFAGRAQLLLTPVDEFSALLNVHGRDLDGTARLFRANIVESGSDEIVDGFERDKIAIDGTNEQKLQTIGGVAKLEYEHERATITSVSGYEHGDLFSRGDIDGGNVNDTPFPAETADAVPNLDQFTQEVRVTTDALERVSFLAGFFYFWEDLDIQTLNYDTPGGGVQNGFATQKQTTNAWALFGSARVDVTDDFKIVGGVRYSDDDKDFVAERIESPFGAGPLAPIDTTLADDFVSWDVSGIYSVNPEHNVYARVARGFRAPSVQGRVLFGDGISTASTEKILSIEGGVKSQIRNRARTNLSVFYYMMDDQQLTAVGGTQNFNTLVNADRSTGVGFEADVDYIPHDQVALTAGASYNKTEIDDDNLGIAPGAASGLTVLNPPLAGDPSVVAINGNSLPNAPEWVINGTLRGSWPVGPQGEAFFFTDWAYRSQTIFFLYDSVEFKQANVIEGGLRVGYVTFDRRYEVAAFARNLTNNQSRMGGIDFNNLTGFVNEPFTWGLEVRSGF